MMIVYSINYKVGVVMNTKPNKTHSFIMNEIENCIQIILKTYPLYNI